MDVKACLNCLGSMGKVRIDAKFCCDNCRRYYHSAETKARLNQEAVDQVDVVTTSEGCTLKLIEHYGCQLVKAQFQDDHRHEVVTRLKLLGNVKNPYLPTVHRVGYIGDGPCNRTGMVYKVWRKMLKDCYHAVSGAVEPGYPGDRVTLEWHNFQTFAAWYNSQLAQFDWVISKDAHQKGNTLYSPELCELLPADLVKLITPRDKSLAYLPEGVRESRRGGYTSSLRANRLLGHWDTAEDAFAAYKEAKEAHIKHLVTGKYSKALSPTVKQSLLDYRVEITD